jgi:hypothetical protein
MIGGYVPKKGLDDERKNVVDEALEIFNNRNSNQSVNGNRDPVIINNDINVKRLKIAIKELVNEHNMLLGDVSDIAVTRGPLSGGYKMIISFERRIDDEQL